MQHGFYLYNLQLYSLIILLTRIRKSVKCHVLLVTLVQMYKNKVQLKYLLLGNWVRIVESTC